MWQKWYRMLLQDKLIFVIITGFGFNFSYTFTGYTMREKVLYKMCKTQQF